MSVQIDPALASLSPFPDNTNDKGKERDLEVDDPPQLHQGEFSESDLQLLLPHLQVNAENGTPLITLSSGTGTPPSGVQQSSREIKRHWTPAEDTHLLTLVAAHGARNWAFVAKELGTGRTAPSCCARWCRLAEKEEVDGAGLNAKEGESGAAGEAVAGKVEGGDLSVAGGDEIPVVEVDQKKKKKGGKDAYKAISKGPRTKWSKWSPEEDADLRSLVAQHGAKNWPFISSLMKTIRSDDSCCGRWTHYLQPKTMVVVDEEGREKEVPTPKSNANAANPRWTPLEDRALKDFRDQNPNASWNTVGDNMDPKRSAGSCRARWVQHVLRFMGKDEDEGDEKQQEAKRIATVVKEQQQRHQAEKSDYNGGQYKDPSLAPPPKPAPVPKRQQQQQMYLPSEEENLQALRSMLDPTLINELVGGANDDELTTLESLKGKKKLGDMMNIDPNLEPDLNVGGEGNADEDADGDAATTMAVANSIADGTKPSVSSRPWGEEEEAHLLQLVGEHGRRGWFKIASLLGTGRTAASASARWHRITGTAKTAAQDINTVIAASTSSAINDSQSQSIDTSADLDTDHNNVGELDATPSGKKASWKAWTQEDDAELRVNVNKYGRNSWKIVGAEMTHPRTEYAASSRWYEHLAKADAAAVAAVENGESVEVESTPSKDGAVLAVKRRWTNEEDAELRALVNARGPTLWAEIGRSMTTGRPGTSCRLRWFNYLCKQDPPAEPDPATESNNATSSTELNVHDPIASTSTSGFATDAQKTFNDMFSAGTRASIDGTNVDLSTILALLPAHAAAQATGDDEMDVSGSFAAVLGAKRALEEGTEAGSSEKRAKQ